MKTDCGEAHIARSTRMAVPPVGREPAGVEFRSSDLVRGRRSIYRRYGLLSCSSCNLTSAIGPLPS